MEYRNFDLEAFDYQEVRGTRRFKVRVEDSPAGQQSIRRAEQVVLPPDLGERLRRLERRRLGLQEMINVGEELANLLLPQRARWMLDRSRSKLEPGEGLRIRLKLDTYALCDLPWEYLYVPGPDTPPDERGPEGFLVLDRRVSLVRYELLSEAAESLDPIGSRPLRLIALLADPQHPDYPDLDLETERQNIERAMSAVLAASSATPSATLDVERLFNVSLIATSTTPDDISLAVQRVMSAVLRANSSTPDDVTMTGLTILISAVMRAMSATTDDVTLSLLQVLLEGVISVVTATMTSISVAPSVESSLTVVSAQDTSTSVR